MHKGKSIHYLYMCYIRESHHVLRPTVTLMLICTNVDCLFMLCLLCGPEEGKLRWIS